MQAYILYLVWSCVFTSFLMQRMPALFPTTTFRPIKELLQARGESLCFVLIVSRPQCSDVGTCEFRMPGAVL